MNTYKDLPDWLEAFIYNDLGGKYEPDRNAFQNNLFSDEEKNKRYLGTYFPRSFAETYCIFCNLFEHAGYRDVLRGKESLAILTFGCGTGGDLMGLLEAIADKLPWVKHLDIVAYDGNFIAVDILKKIVEHQVNTSRFAMAIDYAPVPMDSPADFELYYREITKTFDIIVSLKMVNELYRNNIIMTNPFCAFMASLAPKLSADGVMLVLDVPIKVKMSWIAKLLSKGMKDFLKANNDFVAWIPAPCRVYGNICNSVCYLKHEFRGKIFTSEPVSYCVLSRCSLADRVFGDLKPNCYVVNDSNECCNRTTGAKAISAFDINMN